MNSKKTFFTAWFLGLTALCLPASQALDIHGVNFPDQVQLENSGLVLNGTATRTVWGLKVYVVGLFLSDRCHNCETIMSEHTLPKRVLISMLRKVSVDKFGSTIQENIDNNFSEAEKVKYRKELEAFLACFGNGTDLDSGSAVTIDFIPSKGMVVGVNDHQFEPIQGDEFYHAMLRLWIGEPLQKSIKEGLLGKAG